MNETLLDAARRQHRSGDHERAAATYIQVLRTDPRNFAALYGLGMLYGQAGRFEEAQHLMEEATKIDPCSADAFFALAYALQRLRRRIEAIRCLDRVLELRPDFPEALLNRASAHFGAGRYDEAAADYSRILSLDPDYPFARGNRLFSNLHCVNWKKLEVESRAIADALADGKRVIAPFDGKALGFSPEQELRCARLWVASECPSAPRPLWRGERYTHEKIRLAYVADDFPTHPAAPLLAGVVADHDHSRFETVAVSFGPDRTGPMKARLHNAFNRYVEVRNESDLAIATRLREMETDVVVDLMGFTNGSRPRIFAHRPAPLQVNFLGYPGTMGADYLDYLIADRTVVRRDDDVHYAEKIVTLPDCFMPQDSARLIAENTPSRSEAGLPERGFVFCAFNNVYKITPTMFAIWMRLLLSIEGSVLWLTAPTPVAARNLLAEAQTRGILSERLIFAPFVRASEDHLARLRLADLFLDTLPYNAHATASDALWAGVPVLTCTGQAFAGRVATSLVTALGIPELAVSSLEDYEAMALSLARNSARLAALRRKLAEKRLTGALFDTKRYTRHLDAAFAEMVRRQRRGEASAPFSVAPSP